MFFVKSRNRHNRSAIDRTIALIQKSSALRFFAIRSCVLYCNPHSGDKTHCVLYIWTVLRACTVYI